MPTKPNIPYNRALFNHLDQSLHERDIIDQLTTHFNDYPDARAHALVIIYWLVRDCKGDDSIPIPLVEKVKIYIATCEISERTDMAHITNEIAPRILEMILRVIKPEFFLKEKQETKV